MFNMERDKYVGYYEFKIMVLELCIDDDKQDLLGFVIKNVYLVRSLFEK